MAAYLRKSLDRVKHHYISQLLNAGYYKSSDRQLYELTLKELEKEFKMMQLREMNKRKHGLG
ncbi:Fur-regulated basic protein FbpA [Bacillus sp. Marseille-Q3570]|uniref:Fur-regulated basic protein FbpA n=1 Tax=Bacillus sp. Marseille-Q3570 TaxID=2963522 RepID=UPI0021B81C0D|nr:Fur-regulated basic protein FbpA [Bacillus sp. Marseille-Q3570]